MMRVHKGFEHASFLFKNRLIYFIVFVADYLWLFLYAVSGKASEM